MRASSQKPECFTKNDQTARQPSVSSIHWEFRLTHRNHHHHHRRHRHHPPGNGWSPRIGFLYQDPKYKKI